MSHLPWGHQSRECLICGKVGPRVLYRGHYAHRRCITQREGRSKREKKAKLFEESRAIAARED